MKEAVRILVFKTNIHFKKDLKIISPLLAASDHVLKWNVDRHDADGVLRIECTLSDPGRIINMINEAGYHCEELPD